MDSSFSIVCSLAIGHLGRHARKEDVETGVSLSLVQLQARMSKYNLDTMLVDSRAAPLLISGIKQVGDNAYEHVRLQISKVFGNHPTRNRLLDLAHTLNTHVIDMDVVRTLTHAISNEQGNQLHNINHLASMVAPMLLLQGPDQSHLEVINITSGVFPSDKQAQQFSQHVDAWMRSLMTEQGLDSQDVVDEIMDRVRDTLGVEESKPGHSHSLR